MDIHEIYQEENKFSGDDGLYYILVGEGGSSRISKNHNYYIITCSVIAIYDIDADSMLKKDILTNLQMA